MTNQIRSRNYFIAFIIVVSLLAGAASIQLYQGIMPCPLCSLQRLTLGLLGIFFLMGIFVSGHTAGRYLIGFASILFSLVGITLSGRQVWLQFSPHPPGANCELSLQYMFNVMPIDQLIKKVFIGGSECSRVDWQFLHLSLAQWSCLWFILFLIFAVWQTRK